MEEALIAELLATAGVTALISARASWGRRPQGETGTALCLHRIGGLRDYHLQGPSGLVESRVQADCWAETYAGAKALARAIEAAVSGRRFSRGAIRFDAILIEGERDDDFDENSVTLFRTALDLIVHHAAAS